MHIGIITCEILRREVKEVIEKAGEDKLFLVLPETSNPAINALSRRVNKRFLSELATGDLKIKEKAIEKIESEIHENNIRDSMIIEVMELRMHDCPDKLLAEVEEGIRRRNFFHDPCGGINHKRASGNLGINYWYYSREDEQKCCY
jgi:hypothetical protein